MKNLNEMTVKELKEMAKEMKISNWWNLKKDILIEKIKEVQNMTDEEKQKIADQKAKEDAAIAEYTKHWARYTKRYNVGEFLQKWKSGEIVLENEESELDEIEEETPKIEEQAANTLVETPAPEEITANVVEEQPLKPKRGALIEYNGKSQNICAWGEELGISANTLYGRIYKMSWPIQKAFTTPTRKSK